MGYLMPTWLYYFLSIVALTAAGFVWGVVVGEDRALTVDEPTPTIDHLPRAVAIPTVWRNRNR